ncbi:DMT family transporter [Sphingobium sp. DC-2]|uniref:DMT family transporter n=1 Tax=Sphingobium sp. DC-2 TaxID=1303256 RepID=UPI0004C42D9C|nr:DMT family transporter [Sphingobium sp. DC-2]
MSASPADPRPHRPLLGMALRLGAAVCVSAMFIAGRVASTRGVHIVETLFYRQLLALPVVLSWIAMTGGFGSIRARRIGAHATRMVVGVAGMALNFLSYILLPPAEAVTIGFTMPIFGTILSAAILKEKTGLHRWSAVLVGFLGVLVTQRPDAGELLPLGVAVAIAAAFMTACVSLILRELGRTENAGTIVFWFTALSLPPLGLGALLYGGGHDPLTWALLLFIGLSGGAAQMLLTGALRWAPVSVVLPMDYSSILWIALLGLLIGQGWPPATTWIGASLIMASGLYIAWREHLHARRQRSA